MLSALRAGLHIVDADTRGIAFWASRATKIVNLFHGIPLKRIGADIVTPRHHLAIASHGPTWRRKAMRFLAPWFSEAYDMVVASSEANAAVMASAFKADPADIAVTGLPRNDILSLSDAEVVEHFGISPSPSPAPRKRLILYAPTFRDFERSGRSIPLEWQQLESLMSRYSATFLLKLHPHDAASVPTRRRFKNIQIVGQEVDVYPIMRHVEVLITDYSSVFFDFLLRDRPMIFYPYDIESYQARDREFYYEYDTVTPGDHVFTPQALLERLEEILNGRPDPYREARRQVRARFHSGEGGLSCEAVTKRLNELSS